MPRKIFHKNIAWLIDPDKFDIHSQKNKLSLSNFPSDQIILIGGSKVSRHDFKQCCEFVEEHSTATILIFPGSHQQISKHAHGILLLSLISGRNAKYLIDEHVIASKQIALSKLPVHPTGYLLIDGGTNTSTIQVSETLPLKPTNIDLIERTALAGVQLGMTNIYLEAGSGAKQRVDNSIIFKVNKLLPSSCTLWVGGGFKRKQEITEAWDNGADVVVVGTAIEQKPELLTQLFSL